jgi:nucleotide-binding universal stress UspA family protein
MNPFEHILVPVDFGDADGPAIDLALQLAKKFDAQVTLIHAFDPVTFSGVSSAYPLTIELEPIRAELESELNALSSATCADWPRIDSLLVEGSVCGSIVAAAKKTGCDLIVIGTHGRTGLAHAFLGSVAEKIVRLATVPVLTVHPHSDRVPTASAGRTDKTHVSTH